jgi:hypothetical protein
MNEITKIPEAALPTALPTSNAGALLNIIERAAFDPNVDISRLEMLFEMQRKVLADEAKIAFEQAMTAAQAEMLPVVRDAENKHTKTRYAKLEAIDAAIRPVYTKFGLSLSFNQNEAEKGSVSVTCKVGHVRGHSETYMLTGGLDNVGSGGNANKTPIQALGSSVSYLRRYLTCMIFNVTLTNEDNDGNAARVGTRTITETQKETLIELMQRTNADTGRFLKYCGVDTLDELSMSEYPRALGSLKKKLSEMEASANG